MMSYQYHRIKGAPPPPRKTQAAPSKEDILSTLESYGDQPDGNKPVKNGSVPGHCDDSMVVIDTPTSSGPNNNEDEDFESTSMSTSYKGEWERLFMRPGWLQNLQKMGLRGKLRSTRFRSVCWKAYLQVLPKEQEKWIEKTREWRKTYSDLKMQLIVNPRKAMDSSNLSVNNPLSQEQQSPWNQFFLDNELRLTIKQDVIRTFPELQFFRDNNLHDKMIDVLFCFTKINSKLGYKQGMHELLAPLIFVLHCDHQAFLHASEIEALDMFEKAEREVVKEMLNPEYIEHDAFAMFCQIMEVCEPWYFSKEISPQVKMNNIMTAQPFAKQQELNPSNVIVIKLTRIQDYLLKKFDPDLQAHLEQMDIAPQIYGIRWIRLLFGREFPMQDLLVLWDAIFADSISFDLVDYIFVAMLMYIRELLLQDDYPSMLAALMKYPPIMDIHYFIDKAIYLREPSLFAKPPDVFSPKPRIQKMQVVQASKSKARNDRSANSLLSGLSTLLGGQRKQPPQQQPSANRRRPGTLNMAQNKMSKSTSEPMNLITDQESPEYVPEQGNVLTSSTASLPVMEDTLSSYHGKRSASVSGGIRQNLSATSLARLESAAAGAGQVRSAVSTQSLNYDRETSPEDRSPTHKYSSLPRPDNRRTRTSRRQPQLVNAQEVANRTPDMNQLQGKLIDMENMCQYCASKLDVHIGKLQKELLRQNMEREDELLLALAGLKQVRDFLKGELRFTTNGTDVDTAAHPHDSSYSNQPSPSSASGGHRGRPGGKTFYVDSDMDSSAHTSPEHDPRDVQPQTGKRRLSQGSGVPAQATGGPATAAQAQVQSRPPIELKDISNTEDGSSSHKRVERQSSRERIEAWMSQKTASARRSSQEWANSYQQGSGASGGNSPRTWRFKTVGLFGASDSEDCDKNQNRSMTKSAHDSYSNTEPGFSVGRKFTI